MNKKILIPIILVIVVIISVIIVFMMQKNNNSKEPSNKINMERTNININNTNINSTNIIEENEISNNIISESKAENMNDEELNLIYIKVNNQTLSIELENNPATKELKEKLKNEDIEIKMREYGGFEKVGDLGFSLPREDTNIKTSAGDIVLYQGNQISLFYNSNSWSYTKLGRIQNTSSNELKNILGNGDVTITLTLSK